MRFVVGLEREGETVVRSSSGCGQPDGLAAAAMFPYVRES